MNVWMYRLNLRTLPLVTIVIISKMNIILMTTLQDHRTLAI